MSPRRARNLLEHRSYHITHRCHDRQFLMKFAHDRKNYLVRLREMVNNYPVEVLDYMITSNHVHLLVWAKYPKQISEAFRFLQGITAQDYNRRKKRSGSFWSGRYRATLIQDGLHLARCMFYIDLNMVRNGQVKHPSEWGDCAYDEITGKRQRYRIINRELLQEKIGHSQKDRFVRWYETRLAEKIQSDNLIREAFWTEALAVGDRSWIENIADKIHIGRRELNLADTVYPGERLEISEEPASYYIRSGRRANLALSRSI